MIKTLTIGNVELPNRYVLLRDEINQVESYEELENLLMEKIG